MKPHRFNFRAWNKKRRLMHGPCSMGMHVHLEQDIMEFHACATDENLILMQSTGLVDKNGVEIYEGDIVRGILIAGLAHIRTLFVVRTDEIKYPQSLSFIAIGDPYDNRLDPPNDENTDEVIGNIYMRIRSS